MDVGPHISGCFRPCCSATATSATDVDGCGMLWGNLAGIFPKKERIKTSQSSSKQHPRIAPLLRGILNFIFRDGLMPNTFWGWLTSTQSWGLTRVPSFGQPFFLYATPARSTLPGPMQSTEVSNGHQVLATLVVIPGSAGETWNSHSRMKSCHNHIPECGLTCCLQTQCQCLSLPLMAASHFSCGQVAANPEHGS